MINRLRTSKLSKQRLDILNRFLRFSSNAILLRYAIAKSIECDKDIDSDPEAQVLDNSGFEINRQTLYGDKEILYRSLMKLSYLDNDEKFFPELTNKHIERGLLIIEKEYRFAGNKEKFVRNIINKL